MFGGYVKFSAFGRSLVIGIPICRLLLVSGEMGHQRTLVHGQARVGNPLKGTSTLTKN